MNLIEIFFILICHWICDFVLQTDWQAKNKSSNNRALLQHVTYYSLTFFIAMILFSPYSGMDKFDIAIFGVVTFVAHFITDYFTSRLNTKLWGKSKVHEFFVSIGADQCYHYFQLFITYWMLTK
jgi:hypothetical protein